MQKDGPIAVGIDVGTTAVRCVIGVMGEGSTQPTIIGAGKAKTSGMRKGSVINVEEVAQSISLAVEEAERISGQRVSSATVSVNGAHIIGLNSKGVIAISSTSREITHDDLDRAEEAATVVQLPPNREILQVFARNYSLDGQDNVKDPIGMSGVRLEVDAHIVTAATPPIKNLDRAFTVANIGINHRIVTGLSAAESVLNEKQRESGTVVLDIGAATTSLIVFEEDDVQHVAVIPIGSVNITNDLAIGLKTDLDTADAVKTQHAAAHTGGERQSLSIKIGGEEGDEGEAQVFKRSDVSAIVSARLDELFELVDKELKRINRSGKLPGGVVLVGEGALLPGLDEYVKQALQLPARVAKPRNYSGIIDTTDTPAYASAVGLMMLDVVLGGASGARKASGDSPIAGLRDAMMGIFKRFAP